MVKKNKKKDVPTKSNIQPFTGRNQPEQFVKNSKTFIIFMDFTIQTKGRQLARGDRMTSEGAGSERSRAR